MELVQGYDILETMAGTKESHLYRGRKTGKNHSVIIKTFKTGKHSPAEIARFKQDYLLIKTSELDGIINILEIIEQPGQFALILEDFSGISIHRALKNGSFDLKSFLETAIPISNTLGQLHQKNIVHQAIKPHNIFVNADTGEIKLANFGVSTSLTRNKKIVSVSDNIEDTLTYISPEQTGRMNRIVDYRTDFYSLGITFYEMLTGAPPFLTKDPMEMIYSHIARKPLPAKDKNPNIPQVLSDIIDKLLFKTPEERYQNGFGLLADLTECLFRLKKYGRIEDFDISKKDVPIKFIIPQSLHGREKELNALMSCFERVSHGSKELMVVTGDPGIGKSTLINEVHKPILEKRGFFLSGNFDQFRRDVPYSALIQALQGLIQQLLSQNEEQINLWKEKLLSAFGGNGGLITSVMPKLELIIGKQPELEWIESDEARTAFYTTLKNMINVFAAPEHPLVLFLDDLQWADTASTVFIRRIIAEHDLKSLLLIIAYRKNEIDETHPVSTLMRKLKKSISQTSEIHMGPLDVNAVNDLVAHFLHVDKAISFPLAALVYSKTLGNPFFVNQFFKTLYDQKVLHVDPAMGWAWDLEKIKNMKVTDNVVDLLSDKITCLPVPAQQVLKVCACIGNRFDLVTLSLILEKTLDETLTILAQLTEEGLISVFEDMYRFHHERIHEAAYSLLADHEKTAMHWRIGNLELQNSNTDSREEKILYLVNQLNTGSVHAQTPDERFRLVELNIKAAKTAKRSAAFESSLEFLKKGIALLGDRAWEETYEAALKLHIEAGIACFRINQDEEMTRYCQVVIDHARDVLDMTRVYEIMIIARANQNKLKESLAISLEVLGLLGIHFPRTPNKRHMHIEYAKLEHHLTETGICGLSDLPKMTDPYKIATVRILLRMTLSAITLNIPLYVLAVMKRFELSTTHGFVPESIPTFATLGSILCGIFDKIHAGTRLCRAAIDIADQYNLVPEKLSANMYFDSSVSFWTEHLNSKISHLLELSRDLSQIGHVQPAALCLTFYAGILYTGKNLSELEKEFAQHSKQLSKMGFSYGVIIYQIYMQQIQNLTGGAENPARIQGKIFNLPEFLPILKEIGASIFIALATLHEMMAAYMFEDYAYAEKSAKKTDEYIDFTKEIHVYPIMVFYMSLSRLAVYPEAEPHEQKKIRHHVNTNQKKMLFWAEYGPMNILHHYYLVEAELSRVTGKQERASEYYDKAVAASIEHGYIQYEALSNELAAKFWLNREKQLFARAYMENALEAYSRWGAKAKVEHLIKTYPSLIRRFDNPARERESAPGSTTMDNLDMVTIVKTTQALSIEMDLEKLINKMMHLSIENAGAQKGFLILEKDKHLYVVAEGGPDKDIRVQKGVSIHSHGDLSYSIVYYVARTKEILILNHAVSEGPFTNDPYVIKNQPKSILCLPVIRQSKLVGVLYLENNIAVGAFTPDRVEVLALLSSQAAISIENARLYENVRRAREHVHNLLETANEGFWQIDHEGMTRDVNPEMCLILGRPREEIVGHSFFEFVDEKNIASALSQRGDLKHQKKSIYEAALIRPDGTTVDCLFKATSIHEGENPGSFAMVTDITERKRAEEEIKTLNAELELRVMVRTKELNLTLEKVEKANTHIMESIRYAKMIQQSLLPNLNQVKTWLPNSFFIWEPRDIIGGDFFYADVFENGFILAVVDCTGHGVPGAFMTMIAASGLRRVIRDDGCRAPADILKRLNAIVKTSLQQDTKHALSDDGLDAGICSMNYESHILTFAGARLPLLCTNKGELTVISGDKQSIGYSHSDLNYSYTEHRIPLHNGQRFYLSTDGFVDQLGGIHRRRFGRKRFQDIIMENSHKPFDEQQEILIQAFKDHKKTNDQQDDVTVVGFGVI
ncbi:MAG: AAA family ATPase [Proteobacteria bacterium]|nr:AAA family ATPase [Pseudomonadota bacterium]